jgi:hypothetical protein
VCWLKELSMRFLLDFLEDAITALKEKCSRSRILCSP